MITRTMLIGFLFVLCLVLSVSCSKPRPKEIKEVEDTIKSLRKVQAGTQIGINYQQYGTLLIDAKAAFNGAMPVLSEGELKKEITAAMDAYSDVNILWALKLHQSQFSADVEPGKGIVKRYSIPVKDVYLTGAGIKGSGAEIDDSMQLIWHAADLHLETADTLYRKSLQ